ncbi:MAG: hypothetical protein JNG89_09875 [Planctomycetaceae bacterium]|nr:hypothetical protein [Planctomycetaceae bacterium]
MLAAPALSVSTGAASEPDSTEAVEQPPSSDAPAVSSAASDDLRNLAAETVQLMQQAQAGLADGPLTDDTNTLQAGILERLQQLAELARRQATKSASGQSQASGSRSAAAPNAGDGQGAGGRNDDAAESSEAATGAAEPETGETTATNLATSVWGHLPARQRDRMRSRFSERFLPQYEQLVRQYYEALADEASADP